MLSLLCVSAAVSAQQPERTAELPESDSTAMAVLERYASSSLQAVDLWQPSIAAVKWRPIGGQADKSISSAAVSVRVTLPKIVDMNRLVWKPSSSFSITISNGSAGSSMPWPNCPIGYLDARTLSFPIPR